MSNKFATIMRFLSTLASLALLSIAFPSGEENAIHIRINQLGYLESDTKIAVAFANMSVDEGFEVCTAQGNSTVLKGVLAASKAEVWGPFSHYYTLDFSGLRTPGKYYLKVGDSRSRAFTIGKAAYTGNTDDLLLFMQQQRCGYNPFLDVVCHQWDGRAFYGAVPDSTYVNVSGGWHDAGDQLKYMITSNFAVANMLMAYEMYPESFNDKANDLGQPIPNGIPDVMDEARWGLDWMHRCHPAPDQLVHQVADDRDHTGWDWPDKDRSNYGWGVNSYRAAYFADGKPQGLKLYKSQATGVSNVAGRSAAAFAIAYRVYRERLRDTSYAKQCLKAARELYQMGLDKPGFQQGNSHNEPYRYNEDTWADDMEWAAAELYSVTKDKRYLEQAKGFARKANTVSWMPLDTADHYKYYPFINIGHYALYPHVDKAFKDTLAGYYRQGIEACLRRGNQNIYGIGVPFIWCSNNLTAALITQIILYERMTGDMRYHAFMLAQRDWLFGRNPWGTTMFTGMPRDGEYPYDIHTSVWALSKKECPGGLIDGPLFAKIHNQMRGLRLNEPDEFAAFQNNYVVYHDDIGDYSTNEPTMDGTATSMILIAYFQKGDK